MAYLRSIKSITSNKNKQKYEDKQDSVFACYTFNILLIQIFTLWRAAFKTCRKRKR
jgi:hypothetical protein